MCGRHPERLLPTAASAQQLLGPEEGQGGHTPAASSGESLAGGLGGRLTEDGRTVARGPWLDNSGKRWADLAPLPWAALEQDTGLGPEARIKAGDFAADSTRVGVEGGVGAGGWEEHDFLFHCFGSKNICSCRCSADNLQTVDLFGERY